MFNLIYVFTDVHKLIQTHNY